MSRRPFGPDEAGSSTGRDPVVDELERYARLTSREEPSAGFGPRVMADIEASPAPAGPLPWIVRAFGGGDGRVARATILTASVALAIAVVLFASQVGRLVHEFQVGTSPSPSVIELPTPSPLSSSASGQPTPSASPSPEPPTPEESGAPASEDGGASPTPTAAEEQSRTSRPSPTETPSPSPTASPTPSQSGGQSSDG
jgi:hypothetical protein